ncbi:hypothetical protein L798_04874 [Zootermopsis nevadensis]|uniref:Uncharacterized protein n=1 Tax=Zootermopsis nevadensis TaxID=136037 RepID=A0A067QSJ4_ZOONE|nr:hypothetical protein L798_04874 [Zootermopsis nevadensis]
MDDGRLFVFTFNISNCRDKMTNMNGRRSWMSICVIKNLPNARDYAYKHRDKSMEAKCKEMLDSECNRPSADVATGSNPVARPALVRLKRLLLRCAERVKGFLRIP